VLHVHHVVERLGVSGWDWAFLGVGGIGFMSLGAALIRLARRDIGRGDGSAKPRQ
jgi:hypothetical protein